MDCATEIVNERNIKVKYDWSRESQQYIVSHALADAKVAQLDCAIIPDKHIRGLHVCIGGEWWIQV